MALEALRDLPDHGQATVPLGADRVEPVRGGAQLRAEDAVPDLAADPHRFDEADLLQHREVRFRIVGARLSATARRLDAVGAEWDRRLAVIKEIAEDL